MLAASTCYSRLHGRASRAEPETLNGPCDEQEGRACLPISLLQDRACPYIATGTCPARAEARPICMLTRTLSGLPRRHGGSNFDLSRHGGSHHGDGGPTELERSHRAGSNYEGCTGRSQALPLRLHPRACCLSPSCQIVHRRPWAASHEAAAVHLPKRNSLASATRDQTHAARLTMQAAGSQWEAVLIHASMPCFNARSVACLMRLSVLCSKRKQAAHAIDCHRSNITSPAPSVSCHHQMYKTV